MLKLGRYPPQKVQSSHLKTKIVYLASLCDKRHHLMTLIHFILDTQFFKLSYSIVNNFNFWKKNKLILEPHIIVNLDTFLKASSPKETSCLRLLNPPTIDGCGEGAWWSRRGLQAILEGNHDNPESSTHQAPSAKQHPERREDWGQKTTMTTTRKSNMSKMIDSCESAVKSLRPC